MANQITDNRTPVDNADSVTPYVDLTGASGGTLDTEIFIQGSGSIGEFMTNSLTGILFDAGSAQNWSNNTFYIWINSGIVGLYDTKVNGGFRIRFCGATVTDFFEVYVGGNDSWPPAISGGWTQFVVDIEDAKTNASATGGTPPATTAIRYVGYAVITTVMPRMADNTWIDEIRRLPSATPGIIVEGRNGGATDWNSADINTQLGDATGTFVQSAGGAWKINTPIQFGINDTTTHGFTDTNAIWLWDDQEFLVDSYYTISALGNVSGTTNVTFGSKTGSGVTATGAQGLVIAASSNAVRWDMDFDDPDLDTIGFYGCSFQHGNDFQLDDAAVESVNTLYIDAISVEATNSNLFIKNSFINPNTAIDGSILDWNENEDPDGELGGNSFEKGTNAHHALELGTASPLTQTLRNLVSSGFNASNAQNDSFFQVLRTSGTVTLNIVGGTGNFSYKSAGATVTIIVDPVTTQVNVKDNNGVNLQNARVLVFAADGNGDFPFEETVTITRSGATASVGHTTHGMLNGDIVVIGKGVDQVEYSGAHAITNVTTNAYDYTVSGSPATPATGTIKATGGLIDGLTDVNGDISVSRVITVDTLIRGFVRKSSAGATRFKTFNLTGNTVDDANGLTVNVRLILDE